MTQIPTRVRKQSLQLLSAISIPLAVVVGHLGMSGQLMTASSPVASEQVTGPVVPIASAAAVEAIQSAWKTLQAVDAFQIEMAISDDGHLLTETRSYIRPDRYRRTDSTLGVEVVAIGSDYYIRRGEGDWQALQIEGKGQDANRAYGAVFLEEPEAIAQASYLGTELMGGMQTHLYEFQTPFGIELGLQAHRMPSQHRLWVAAQTGLPHRLETAVSFDGSGDGPFTLSSTSVYTYSADAIEPPVASAQ